MISVSLDFIKAIFKMYQQAIHDVPLLKYSSILMATIFILALASFFKLINSDVFWYAGGVIIISAVGLLLTYLLYPKNKLTQFLLNVTILFLGLLIITVMVSFGFYIISGKPDFYNRWFHREKFADTKRANKEKPHSTENDSSVNDGLIKPKDTAKVAPGSKEPVNTNGGNKDSKQYQVVIEGTIRDEEGYPLEGVTVSAAELSTTSKPNGEYKLTVQNLASKEIKVNYLKTGYKPDWLSAFLDSFRKNNQINLDITLHTDKDE